MSTRGVVNIDGKYRYGLWHDAYPEWVLPKLRAYVNGRINLSELKRELDVKGNTPKNIFIDYTYSVNKKSKEVNVRGKFR